MLEKYGQKGEKLEDAEFKVNYYDGIHKDVSNFKPLKSWTFKTNKEGYFSFDDKYKISGDELIKDSNGKPIGLIGTYEIIETKAPLGYIINNEIIITHVKDD